MTGPDDAGLDGQRRMWTIGDYPAIARHLRPISLQVLDTVGVTAGQRVLDVGGGDGNTAIEAAARGLLGIVSRSPAPFRRPRADRAAPPS